MWMYYALLGLVFFASLAMMVREGLWSNTITFMNIIFSGLVAFGFYSPLTTMADEALEGSFTYVLDFLILWAVFAIAMIITRILTDRISRTRLRLKYPIDTIGGPLVGTIAAFVMTSFVAATLYSAPLAKDAMGGKLALTAAEVESTPAFTAPEVFWLRFVQQVGVADGFGSRAVQFEAGPFAKIYVDHRQKLQDAPSLKVRR